MIFSVFNGSLVSSLDMVWNTLEKGTIISHPTKGEVGVSIPIFEVGMKLSTTDFFDEVMSLYGFRMSYLTTNAINKNVGFELVCRTLGVLPQFWAFKAFFNSSTQSGAQNFCQRRGVHAFIIN